MSIKIISVGKKHEDWIRHGIERYQKRLRKPFDIEWQVLPHSSQNGLEARQIESKHILKRLNNDDYVILLDEKGINLNSPALSDLLFDQISKSKNVVIVIGGAFGVDEVLHEKADFVWSLSNLVFPHQLVRLILIEQIYRSQEIANNGKYHHQ